MYIKFIINYFKLYFYKNNPHPQFNLKNNLYFLKNNYNH